MEATKHIDLTKPLPDVDRQAYERFALKARELKIRSSRTDELVQLLATEDKQNLVANYAYMIYEYLDLNKTRNGTDYSMLKGFAAKYRDWLDYILDGRPVRYKMNVWLRDPEQITEIGMYTRTNRNNKNVYH